MDLGVENMIKNINDTDFSFGTGRLDALKRKVKKSHSQQGRHTEKEDQKLMEACEGFEAMFLQKTLESMRDTLPGNALFKESNGMKIFRSMHDQYLAEDLSKSHKFGISDFLYRELHKK